MNYRIGCEGCGIVTLHTMTTEGHAVCEVCGQKRAYGGGVNGAHALCCGWWVLPDGRTVLDGREDDGRQAPVPAGIVALPVAVVNAPTWTGGV